MIRRVFPPFQTGSALLKAFGIAAISAVSLATVFWFVDIGEVVSAISHVGFAHVALSSALLVAGNVLAYGRFANVLSAFNAKPGRRDLLTAFSVGQISNQFLLNILGQSVTRAMVLSRSGVPISASMTATYIERLLAAGVLFFLSLVSLWYLLHQITFDPARIGYLAFFAVALIAVAGAGAAICFGSRARMWFGEGLSWLTRLWPSVLLTLLIHVSTLLAYLTVLETIQPGSATWGAVAALTIVMFTAALPISFSGWGVRELSAVTALGVIGLPAQVAVSTAFVIGALSLVVMFAFMALSLCLRRGSAQERVQAVPEGRGSGIDRLAIAVCALLCALFIGFQLRVPVSNGELSVNLADPIAMTGVLLCLYHIVFRRAVFPLRKWAAVAVMAVAGVLLAGIVSAYLQGVLGRWALLNRGVGWLVILCYVMTGAAAVAYGGERRRLLLMQGLVIGVLTICALHIALLLVSYTVHPVPAAIIPIPLQGFVNNSNAFAFLLALAGVIMVVMAREQVFNNRPVALVVLFALLMLTVYYCKSRTGLLLMVLLGCAMLAFAAGVAQFPQAVRRPLRLSVVAMLGVFAIAALLPEALYVFAKHFDPAFLGKADWLMSSSSLGIKITHDASDNERAEIMSQAIDLWLAHPFLGAGLGAFTEWRLASGMTLQVIHSVPMWLLAEMGIGGIGIAAAIGLYALARAWSMLQAPATRTIGLGLMGILLVMGIGSVLQDYFFQRAFWFMFGVFCAVPLAEADQRKS